MKNLGMILTAALCIAVLCVDNIAWGQKVLSTVSLPIRINEVDTDQTGTDSTELVELVGPASAPLTGILVVFHNGSSAFSAAGYRTHDLSGQSFPSGVPVCGTNSFFVLGPANLLNFTSQSYNTLYSTGWPSSNAIQNGGTNEGDGVLVAFDANSNGTFEDTVDIIPDKFAYVGSGSGADGGSATAVGFKAIYGSTG